jgi:hypothetical protein
MIRKLEMPKEYGPYSRKQSAEVNELVASSGELWGAAARNIYAGSDPAVKAFLERLQEGVTEIEFVTIVEPGRGRDPAQVRWPRGHPGVREVESNEVIAKLGKSRARMLGDVVAIPVRITKRVDE